jgi:hypothetical protein
MSQLFLRIRLKMNVYIFIPRSSIYFFKLRLSIYVFKTRPPVYIFNPRFSILHSNYRYPLNFSSNYSLHPSTSTHRRVSQHHLTSLLSLSHESLKVIDNLNCIFRFTTFVYILKIAYLSHSTSYHHQSINKSPTQKPAKKSIQTN